MDNLASPNEPNLTCQDGNLFSRQNKYQNKFTFSSNDKH